MKGSVYRSVGRLGKPKVSEAPRAGNSRKLLPSLGQEVGAPELRRRCQPPTPPQYSCDVEGTQCQTVERWEEEGNKFVFITWKLVVQDG